MKTSEFWDFVQDVKDISSSSEKRTEVFEFIDGLEDEELRVPLVSILVGTLDDLGVNKKTVRKTVDESQIPLTEEQLSDLASENGTLTESLMSVYSLGDSISKSESGTSSLKAFQDNNTETTYGEQDMSEFYEDIVSLQEVSGDNLIRTIADLFEEYYPPLVVMTINPSDYSTGAKRKSVQRAFGEQVTDSLDEVFRLRGLNPRADDFVRRYYAGDLITEPQPGEMFAPMLAKKLSSSTEVSDLMESDQEDYTAQIKFDGNRILIHRTEDGELLAHTRSFNDYTESIHELSQIEWPETSFILDCEIVAIDPDTGEELEFTKTGALRRDNGTKDVDYSFQFKFFDMIHYNGTDLSTKPQKDRLNSLSEFLEDVSSPYVFKAETYTNIEEALRLASERDEEGIMVKKMSKNYVFKRSRNWQKIKNRMETVDLIIKTIEEGSGNKAQSTGRMKLETADGTEVGYVGTGLDDDLAKEMWENQDDYLGRVVEIQFDGFDEALRIPSFQRFRPEGEADTLSRLKNISNS